MTALRQRMLEDMKIRNLALKTQASYLRQVGMPRLSPRAHDRNRRDSSWQHSGPHRHLVRTITGTTVDFALHQLAFGKSTPKYSRSRLPSWFTGSLHLAGSQSKSFLYFRRLFSFASG
jgi:hypothetical protein